MSEEPWTEACELFLAIRSDGEGYDKRLSLAKYARDNPSLAHGARYTAKQWLYIAADGARQYEKKYGSSDASCFTPIHILQTAILLSDFYEEHITEVGNANKLG